MDRKSLGQTARRAGNRLRRPLTKGVRRRTAPGTPPGVILADPAATPSSITLMGFTADQYEERKNATPDDIAEMRTVHRVVWIDVTGLGDVDLIRKLGAMFDIHPLVLEDIVNVHQRAKTEDYDDKLYMVVRMVHERDHLDSEQISIILGEGYVITFQEHAGDCFDPVRARVRREGTRMRTSGADYLAYALIDAVIDSYFPVLEAMGDRIEALEDDVVRRPDPQVVETLHALRHDLLAMRRAVWPHREMINTALRQESRLIAPTTGIYLRDCYDHAVQLMDIVETYREIASGLLDVYLSSLSNRMNEIMKVLTIIATIFIPLSFVAGVYGMNFDPAASPWNMPELRWPYGYPVVLGAMGAGALAMLVYFWRRGWIGRSR
ncbi:MAG: magnesium and cobalt transport protein CorA [Alphaproteobacteria bacterium]|nr:MAG: magnesium and cobalt transport protein CorA [Alphaproteobacteria bacterium]